MMRPTLRAALLFGATIPVAAAMLVLRPDLWALSFDPALFILGLIAVDALLTPGRSRFEVKYDAPARLFIGAADALRVTVTQYSRARLVALEALAEHRGELEPPHPGVLSCPREQPATLSLPLSPTRRGEIVIDAVWLRWRGPFSLVEASVRQPVGKTIAVLPDVRGVPSAGIRFFTRDAVEGVKVQQNKGEGVEFEALREHTAGLDNRFIDWKRSAKQMKLLSKEFRTERNHQIVLAFDTGHLMSEPLEGLPRLDHAIHAGLLLGWVSLRSGDYVGSFGFDSRVRQYMEPARGMPYFTRLQHASARMAYHADETNFTLGLAELNARLKRRALVALFTEFIDTITTELLLESVQRMANRHAVVFVTLRDPFLPDLVDRRPDTFRDVAKAVVASDLLRERAVVKERLARMGVHCLDVAPKGLAVGLINRYLMIKQRGLI